MATFETVAQVVTQAAKELGLTSSAIADPFASSDANILQMTALLADAGQEIVREHRWTQSIAEQTFVTIQGTDNYAFPADFLRMVPQTGWNRTNRLPVGGPVDSEAWQYLKGRLVGVVFNVIIRKWKGRWYFFPDGAGMPGGYTIAMEYMSSNWVALNATPTVGAKYAPTLANDYLLYDTFLMKRALKRTFLRAKGFPSQAAEDDYQKALAQVMDDDAAARVHYLTPSHVAEPLLSAQNVPPTGFGG